MAVCTYPAKSAALGRTRELIHNHGKIYVKRGEWVHDNSMDTQKNRSCLHLTGQDVIVFPPLEKRSLSHFQARRSNNRSVKRNILIISCRGYLS
jgi:hypothetical protein